MRARHGPQALLLLFLFLWSSGVVGVKLLAHSAVDLQEARLSTGYKQVLDTAYRRVVSWCNSHSETLPADLQEEPRKMSEMLARHLQYLFEGNYGVSAGRQALLAVQLRFRHLRGQLTLAWDSVRSWEHIAPIQMRVPMPWLVLDAMFCYALLRGFEAQGTLRRDFISFAVCLGLAFDALLRPGEVAILTPQRVALPDSRLHGLVKSGLVTITNGKNRRTFGRIQIAAIHEVRVIEWLQWLTTGMEPEARLLPGGTQKFSKMFHLVAGELGLSNMKLSPASLRAGGATHKFTTGQLDLGQLKFRGIWTVMSTLEHYVQECSATLVMLRLGEDCLTSLERIVQFGAKKFKHPPAFPWSEFFDRARQIRPASNGSLALAGRRRRC